MDETKYFSRALEIRNKYPDLAVLSDNLSKILRTVYNMEGEKQKAFYELQNIIGIRLNIEGNGE